MFAPRMSGVKILASLAEGAIGAAGAAWAAGAAAFATATVFVVAAGFEQAARAATAISSQSLIPDLPPLLDHRRSSRGATTGGAPTARAPAALPARALTLGGDVFRDLSHVGAPLPNALEAAGRIV